MFYREDFRENRRWFECEMYDGDWRAYLDERAGGEEGRLDRGDRTRVQEWLRRHRKLADRATVDLDPFGRRR